MPSSNTLEIFIKIDDDDCDYYIVDFERQTIFWLTTVGTEELGISAAASQSHLGAFSPAISAKTLGTHVRHY